MQVALSLFWFVEQWAALDEGGPARIPLPMRAFFPIALRDHERRAGHFQIPVPGMGPPSLLPQVRLDAGTKGDSRCDFTAYEWLSSLRRSLFWL